MPVQSVPGCVPQFPLKVPEAWQSGPRCFSMFPGFVAPLLLPQLP